MANMKQHYVTNMFDGGRALSIHGKLSGPRGVGKCGGSLPFTTIIGIPITLSNLRNSECTFHLKQKVYGLTTLKLWIYDPKNKFKFGFVCRTPEAIAYTYNYTSLRIGRLIEMLVCPQHYTGMVHASNDEVVLARIQASKALTEYDTIELLEEVEARYKDQLGPSWPQKILPPAATVIPIKESA